MNYEPVASRNLYHFGDYGLAGLDDPCNRMRQPAIYESGQAPPYGHHRDGQTGRMGDQRQERNSGYICRGGDDKREDSSQQASAGP